MAVGAAVLVVAPLTLARSTVDHTSTQLSAPSQLLAESVTSLGAFGTTPGRPMTDEPRRMPASVMPVVHHVAPLVFTAAPQTRHVATHTARTASDGPTGTTHERTGDATWYDWYPGQCAVHYLPKGTEIWITDLQTGKTITCLVTDYEADASRAVDMNETSFAELAPLSQGVIPVKVTW